MGRLFDILNLDYLTNANAIGGTYPFSMACWFYKTSVLTDSHLMGVYTGASGNNRHYIIASIAAGPVAGALRGISRTSSNGTAVSAIAWTVNTLHHAAVRFVSAANRVIYLDGGNSGSNTTNLTPSGMNTTEIGRDLNAADAYMSGHIFLPTIWNIDIGATNIASLANGRYPKMVRGANIVGFWPLGISSPEVDYSGNNRPLTLSGSPTISTIGVPRLQLPFGDDRIRIPTSGAAAVVRMLASMGVGR